MARGAVLGMDDAAFAYGARRVFDKVAFLLDDAKTALVGENGAGKSTLLKCLVGELELNRGKVLRSRGLRIGSLPQEVGDELDALTVREIFTRSLRKVGAEGDDWRIDVLLAELGLDPAMAEARFGTLSGGWRRLTLIAAAARLEEPDILVLDEPTNHLDIVNINTLETWLTETFDLPMLIVSHDREFLGRVTTRTLFLRSDGLHAFKAPFAEAREELLRRDAAAATRRKLEDKEVKRLEKVAARYAVWAIKNPDLNKRKKATETRIRHIEERRAEVWTARKRRLELSDADIEAKVALRIQDFTVCAPDGRELLHIDRLAVAAGEKIALLGPNGSGKSTLLTLLAKSWDPSQRHYDGKAAVRFNPSSRLVYFDQAMADLPIEQTPLDYLAGAEQATQQSAVKLLAQAGFPFARIGDPIALLSYGERSRLMFLRMKLAAPNFYFLDEPTSHLDIDGQEDLESQLEDAETTCVFVSHDRYFTRTAATRFLEIRRRRLVDVEDADDFFNAQTDD